MALDISSVSKQAQRLRARPSSILIGSLFCLFLSGCTYRLYEEYNYNRLTVRSGDFEIRAGLLGTFNSMENRTIKGVPYDLRISFKTTKPSGKVSLIGVKLLSIDDRRSYFQANDVAKRLEPELNYHIAYFSFSGLDLEYVPYILTFSYEIEVDGVRISDEIELHFETDFKKYRHNWWQWFTSQ